MPNAIKPPEEKRSVASADGAMGRFAQYWWRSTWTERLKERGFNLAEAKPVEKKGMDRHPRPNLTAAFVEPRTETERLLAEIWASQLGLEGVGIHDRFFDLGGHSLLAAQIRF